MTADGRAVQPTDVDAARFCATGALVRAAFDLTGSPSRARELCYEACFHLLPGRETPQQIVQDLNDTSIGYITMMALFERYLGIE